MATRLQAQRLARRFARRPGTCVFSSATKATAPKFPIPAYGGSSRPVPTAITPPLTNANDEQQREIAGAIRPSYQSQTPLLLQNLVGGCDAIYFWRSREYWRAAVGEDTPVEIEVGKSYNSGKRVPIRFGDYLDYLALSVEQEDKEQEQLQAGQEVPKPQFGEQEVAYLAQNELFTASLGDIPIPSFCEKDGYNVGEGKLYHTMLWMGPRHTVSPLHFDPLDNILMQIVGWKRVLLFPADEQSDERESECQQGRSDDSWWHYAGADYNQHNTSAVDVENPEYMRYPNFRSAPTPYECLLGPGDALFIPKRWWHHVRSLELSVSANVWWR